MSPSLSLETTNSMDAKTIETMNATAYSLTIGGSAFDRLYADFEGIGAIVTWVNKWKAYRVRIHKATTGEFDAMVNKWKAIGATLITH